MKIAIDIGHTTGRFQPDGTDEHELATSISVHLFKLLTNKKHEAYLVDFPEMKNGPELVAAANRINAIAPDLCVSIHCDWGSPAARGAHVIYYPSSKKGKAVAENVAKHITELMPGRSEKTVARNNLYILSHTKCPAILVECGFMSNRDDAFMQKHSPNMIAQTIAQGIEDSVDTLR